MPPSALLANIHGGWWFHHHQGIMDHDNFTNCFTTQSLMRQAASGVQSQASSLPPAFERILPFCIQGYEVADISPLLLIIILIPYPLKKEFSTPNIMMTGNKISGEWRYNN